jgi:hypothetical protein
MSMPWEHYFCFDAKTAVHIDGPWSYDGDGVVHERTTDVLDFELHMPARSFLGRRLPKLDLRMKLVYVQEGGGNRAEVTVSTNDEPPQHLIDENVTMHSSDARRRRTLASSLEIAGERLTAVLRRESDDETDLDLNGYDFDIERR